MRLVGLLSAVKRQPPPAVAARLHFLRHASAYRPHVVEAKWRRVVTAAAPRQSAEPGHSSPLASQAGSPAQGTAQATAQGITEAQSTDASRPLYYLAMFPYPSGALHMGHVRVYTIPDALARFQRLRGNNVFVPMGWDAFGLPAENAARERGLRPSKWTYGNITAMKEQLDQLGLAVDWSSEIVTSRPEYYRWTQWLFLKLYEHGLVYRASATVNWDPVDKTVLANEQVDSQGRSWRSGALVEKRQLHQWFIRITAYAEDLLRNLEGLHWPKSILEMQKNWIGRSEGAQVDFPLVAANAAGAAALAAYAKSQLTTFTTRPETIYGVTFLAVHPGHELARAAQRAEVSVLHPLTRQPLPLLVAPYIVDSYGTGAVMGVPGHDERDKVFAEQHKLPIKTVTQGDAETMVNSGPLNGMSAEQARQAAIQMLVDQNAGRPSTSYRLHDWLISRQRYWGTPIPMVHCESCGVVPVAESDLPVLLPPEDHVDLQGAQGSPLQTASAAWLETPCPKCHGPAHRDTDTLDTFVDSAWYYLRYLDAHNSKAICDADKVKGMPVDLYVGGPEHAVSHLLYARFFCKFMQRLGLVADGEPFRQLLTQGMVLGRTHKSSVDQRYLKPADITKQTAGAGAETAGHTNLMAIEVATGKPTLEAWEKMSKSKYNGVLPEDIVKQYGIDTMRTFILFKAPPEIDLEWDADAVSGVSRWLGRVWHLVQSLVERHAGGQGSSPDDAGRQAATASELKAKTNTARERVTHALSETHALNVAVAALMELSNALRADGPAVDVQTVTECTRALLVMIVPFAPHLALELWEQLQSCPSQRFDPEKHVFEQRWPEPMPLAHVQQRVRLGVQIQGRLRGQIEVDEGDAHDTTKVLQAVQSQPVLAQILGPEPKIKRVILPAKGRVVSIVTE